MPVTRDPYEDDIEVLAVDDERIPHLLPYNWDVVSNDNGVILLRGFKSYGLGPDMLEERLLARGYTTKRIVRLDHTQNSNT